MNEAGQGHILTTQDLEVLRAQQMLIVERQGEHGARITAIESNYSGIQSDLREIRDLIRQGSRGPQNDATMLAMHNLADAMRNQLASPAQTTPQLSTSLLTQFASYIGLFALGSVLGQPIFTILNAMSPP